jgi:hypothetical protein
MRGMLAPLSPNEETTLRRVAIGTEGELDPIHVRRLLQLELIEWDGWTWRLTSVGLARCNAIALAAREGPHRAA